MTSPNSNLRGIAYMVAATAAFIINDTMLKFLMVDLPPFETLAIRGFLTMIWVVPLLALTGSLGKWRGIFNRAVMARNGFEMVAVLGYILALKFAPIADVTALSQLTPMLVTLGAVWLYGAKVGRGELVLIATAFAGAVLVAQPGGNGFTPFALLGLWNATGGAARDVAGRRVPAEIPGLAVAFGAGMLVMVGAGAATLTFEQFVMPDLRLWLLLVVTALFLTTGHLLIFLAYRYGEVRAVAPFYYSATVWALIAGAVAFGVIPNALALGGMALILVSGIAVVWLDARRTAFTG